MALPLTLVYVGKRVFCPTTSPLTKASFQCGFLFLFLELPCYVTLLCGAEQLPNFISEWSQECLIPLVKAFTKVKFKEKKNQLGLTPDRCLFHKVFCFPLRRGKYNNTGRLPVLLCYVTWVFFYCYLWGFDKELITWKIIVSLGGIILKINVPLFQKNITL